MHRVVNSVKFKYCPRHYNTLLVDFSFCLICILYTISQLNPFTSHDSRVHQFYIMLQINGPYFSGPLVARIGNGNIKYTKFCVFNQWAMPYFHSTHSMQISTWAHWYTGTNLSYVLKLYLMNSTSWIQINTFENVWKSEVQI